MKLRKLKPAPGESVFQSAANGGMKRASSSCTKNCAAFKFKAACHNCRKHDLTCRLAERTAHIVPIIAPDGSSNQGSTRLSNQLIKRASEGTMEQPRGGAAEHMTGQIRKKTCTAGKMTEGIREKFTPSEAQEGADKREDEPRRRT